MNKNLDINIFIENEYEQISDEQSEVIPNIDCAKLTQDAISMVKYFLQNSKWVKNSCLDENETPETIKLLYFDIVFCNNEKIHEINKEYRQKDAPTDVITFAMYADSPKEERFIFDGEVNLGEIIISLDKTLEQSKDNSHHQNSFEDELYFLIAHGILHLLGYDHKDEETLQQMWNMQSEMCKILE